MSVSEDEFGYLDPDAYVALIFIDFEGEIVVQWGDQTVKRSPALDSSICRALVNVKADE